MIKFINRHLILCFICFCFSISSVSDANSFAYIQAENVAQDLSSDSKSYEVVRSWKRLGSFWELGLNAHGEAVAIYDLSYPDFHRPIQFGTLNTKLSSVKNSINNVKIEILKNSAQMRQINTYEVKQAVKELDLVSERVGQISRESDQESILPRKWWKHVPWVDSRLAHVQEEPESFTLADFDLSQMKKDSQKLEDSYRKFNPLIWRSIRFEKKSTGIYSISWSPIGQLDSEITDLTQSPFLFIDIKNPKLGLAQSLAWESFRTAILALVSQIPIPVVAGFISVGLSEYFQLVTEVYSLHQQVGFEMVDLYLRNRQIRSSFSMLNSSEVMSARDYLLYADSSLLTAIQWAFLTPEKLWERRLQSAKFWVESGHRWLKDHFEELRPISDYYTQSYENGSRKYLYILPKFRFPFQRPHIAIDDFNRDRIKYERQAYEVSNIAVQFLTGFIPFPMVGGVVATLYQAAVILPMHQSQYWESRLQSHLIHRMENFSEDWSSEIETLHEQKINPFETPPNELYRLVKERRERFHLP